MRIGASLAGAQLRILHNLAAANAASALSAQIHSIERDQSAVQAAIGRVNAAANFGSQQESVDSALAALAILQQWEASALIRLK